MKIKRKELYAFYNIVGVAQFDNSKPIKTTFRYMLSKNLKKCKSEMDDIDALFPAPAGYDEYIKSRVAVFQKYGISIAPNGAVNMDQVRALGQEKELELNDELGKLYENNKEIVDQVETMNSEKLKFVEEEIEMDFEKISVSDVPDLSEKEENHWEIWNLLERIAIK